MADLQDPLQDLTGLSLFPRTFLSLSLPDPPRDPACFHNFLQSLPVRNPDKLIKEAERILADAVQVPNPKMTNSVVSEDTSEVVANEKAVKYPRGQRPGLDRKRPRFSLLPSVRQPTVNLEPTLDFDKLKDPEEFFSAYERLTNAKKEIARQTGHAFTGFDQYNVFNVPQSQRPGLPGRSRTKYKHLYPTMSSQETSEMDSLSNSGSQEEIAYAASQQTQPVNVASQELEALDDASQQTESEEMELRGSVVKVEDRVNKLLDDLIASGELEGDGALNLLQDKLQIKPLHIEKLNLPELQDIPRIDFKASGVNLPKRRNTLSDTSNLLKGTRSKTPMKLKTAESSVLHVGSPTPPKSPLASLSLLKQRILQSNLSNDPFSADDIDQLPARNTSHVENIYSHSEPVDVEKTIAMSGNLNSQKNEKNDGTVGSMSSNKVGIEDFTSLFEKHVDEDLLSLGTGGEIGPRKSGSKLDDNNVGLDNEVINENLCQAGSDIDLHINKPNELEDMVEDAVQEAVTSAQPDKETDDVPVEASNSIQKRLVPSNSAADGEHAAGTWPELQGGAAEQSEGTALERHNEEIEEPTMVSISKQRKEKQHQRKGQHDKAPSRRQSHADPAMAENQAINGCLEYHDTAQEQNEEQKIQEPSETSTDEGTKKERKSKAFSKRQSLAGCGMSWESGVRRSTRIKSRPLEYWKGERFLYGRIHESLATVIGVKYASPGKDMLKVKSFVSDEYKGLVEQAALY